MTVLIGCRLRAPDLKACRDGDVCGLLLCTLSYAYACMLWMARGGYTTGVTWYSGRGSLHPRPSTVDRRTAAPKMRGARDLRRRQGMRDLVGALHPLADR